MRIKYKLTYEWMNEEHDIIDHAVENEYSINEAIDNLIQWNHKKFADRLNAYAMRKLGFEGQFECEVVDDR